MLPTGHCEDYIFITWLQVIWTHIFSVDIAQQPSVPWLWSETGSNLGP